MTSAISSFLPEYSGVNAGSNFTGSVFAISDDAAVYTLGSLAAAFGSLVSKGVGWINNDVVDYASGIILGSPVRTPHVFAGSGGPYNHTQDASDAAAAAITSAVASFPGCVKYGSLSRLTQNGGLFFYTAFACIGLP